MRLLFALMTMALVVGIVGFLVTNPHATVPVRVWNTTYPGIWIGYIAICSLVVGIVFIGIIALAEGANTRLENRRLRRDILKLETEVNYHRTQPVSSPARAPREDRGVPAGPVAAAAKPPEPDPPQAPVYRPESPDDYDDEPDDDAYSGGRAV